MNSIKLGKKIVNVIIIILLLTNVIYTISKVVNGQVDDIATTTLFGIVRFAINASILYYLYKGEKLAKWLIVILAFLNGIFGFLGLVLRIISLLLASNISLIAKDFINMPIYIIYIIIGVVLIVSSPVNEFLTYQREVYQKECNDYESES